MLFAIGAASSAIDLLKSLTSSNKTSSPQGSGFSATTSASSDTASSPSPTTVSGAAPPSGNVAPETMSALLDAQSQSTASSSTTSTKSQSKALKDLFNQIDGNGDGSITKSEFETALGAGGTNTANADSVFSKLDKDSDGKVSLDELGAALKGKGGHRHQAHGAGGAGGSSDQLLQALDGASTSSTSNSDGSTTTALTYADGSKVTMTSAPSSSAAGNATSSYNVLEQMIQRQANTIASGSTLSVSA